MNTSEMLATNQRNWDARTPVHVDSEFYDLPGLRAGADRLAAFEWAELGDLTGRELVHLQCHLGTDTICLARAGATVAGLDFSSEAISQARQLVQAAGVSVDYVQANVLDAVEAFGDRRFDLVYTGKGSLVWLPDLDAWANVVAELLRPGGELYLVEFHPLVAALGDDAKVTNLRIRYDMLGTGVAEECDGPVTYTDGPLLTGETRSFQWTHDIGKVVSAVAGAGLRVFSVQEHAVLPWQPLTGMVPVGGGWWGLPAQVPNVPLIYSLRAVREV